MWNEKYWRNAIFKNGLKFYGKSQIQVLSLKVLILFKKDQTSKWLSEKMPSAHAELLATAKRYGPKFKTSSKSVKRKYWME